MRLVHLPDAVTVVLDVVAWGLIHAGTGYGVHRLSPDRLGDSWLYRARRFERDGAFYARRLRINRWKDRLPEAGGLFTGGVSKRRLPPAEIGGLDRFVIETRRAELAHWLCLVAGPLFILFNPPLAAVLLVTYGVAVNLPFVAIQRYNRLRTMRVLRRRAARLSAEG